VAVLAGAIADRLTRMLRRRGLLRRDPGDHDRVPPPADALASCIQLALGLGRREKEKAKRWNALLGRLDRQKPTLTLFAPSRMESMCMSGTLWQRTTGGAWRGWSDTSCGQC
jgi:hypothetical protein